MGKEGVPSKYHGLWVFSMLFRHDEEKDDVAKTAD